MSSTQLNRWGGTGAILLGLTYVLIGIAFLMDPVQAAGNSDIFYNTMARSLPWHIVFLVAFIISGVLGLLVAYPITNAVTPPRYGWLRVLVIFALIGFAATVIDYIWLLIDHPARSLLYVQETDPEAKRAIIRGGFVGIDREGWMSFGSIGLWVLAISVLGFWAQWPRLLCGLGIIAAIFYWIVLNGNLSYAPTQLSFAAAVGGIILAPIWYTWIGLRLRRAAPSSTPSPDRAAPPITMTQGR